MRTILATLHSKFVHASLALPYLAAFCGKECGTILLREFTVHEPREQVLAAMLSEEPDVVCFSVYLWNRRESLELADALAAARPGVRVVLGGPETSFDGEALFASHPGVTALIRGEGELPVRALLGAWSRGEDPEAPPRVALRTLGGMVEGPDSPPLEELDAIPSPFEAGLVDLSRGLVYLETSRGCPYSCAFCMSSLDSRVRSYSMERIRRDLALVMDKGVSTVKLVDRTFNYDPRRAREIFRFILDHNRGSRFHFEIGAHLLDDETIAFLEAVPPGVFQFEIGVQSTLPGTLEAIGRSAPLDRLTENVRRLRSGGNIHLHLDLIAGLPGEGYASFLCSIDRVAALRPHHLQVEPVKLLPGAPLRRHAEEHGIRFDPHPPYSVLATADLSFAEIERLRGIGRLLDLLYNSGRFGYFLEGASAACGTLSRALERLEAFFRRNGLFRSPLSQRGLFEAVWNFVRQTFRGEVLDTMREHLARDFARCERVVPGTAPPFFDLTLTESEAAGVREQAKKETEAVRGKGIKFQHFAAVFRHLPDAEGRTVLLFLYFTRSGEGMEVRESRIR